MTELEGVVDEKVIDPKKGFRFQNQRVLLTYAWQEDKKIFEKWFRNKFPVAEMHIAHETGETGHKHMHVVVNFGKAFQSKKPEIFDYEQWSCGLLDIKKNHPNITVVRMPWQKNWQRVLNYIAKSDPECAHLRLADDVGTGFVGLKKIWEAKTVQDAIKGAITMNKEGEIKYGEISGIERAFALRPKPPVKYWEPKFPWQLELIEELKKDPDDRTIVWYYDSVGKSGKTSLARYLQVCEPDKYFVATQTNGMKDFAHVINNAIESGWSSHCIFFNLARSDVELKIYKPLECVKDGIITSVKYNGKTMIFNWPHVVVFANFLPEVDKLSLDRWVIRKITAGGECEPITLDMARTIVKNYEV